MDSTNNNWSPVKKISFRFFFVYFSLFIISKNNGAYPFLDFFTGWYSDLLKQCIPWIGKNILGITYEIGTKITGSGDRTYDYLIVLVSFIIAIIAAIVWSLLDKKSKNHKKLYYWLTVAIRFYVGLMLINYGAAKLFKTQFSYPSLWRLTQPYGESSPMGIAWTFLGFSKGYNIFMGFAEVASVLLLFRKTVTIGAIITLMSTANVMAVNYFYDVPVKLTTTHLVVMTCFLLAANFKTLIQFFFRIKESKLSYTKRPIFKNRNINKLITAFKYIVIIASLYGIYNYTFNVFPNYRKKPKLYGYFEVEKFQKNGKELTHYKDSVRWKNFRITSPRGLSIRKLNGRGMYFRHNIDTINSQIELIKYRDSTKRYMLNYKKNDSILTFNVIIEKDTLTGKARCKTEKNFLLMNRGFHWISERPYNR